MLCDCIKKIAFLVMFCWADGQHTGECAEKFSCPPSPNLKQIENISTTGSRTPSPDTTEALKEVVLQCVAKDPTAWLDMTRVSAKISKLFLEAQDWAEKFRVPTNTSISLFLLCEFQCHRRLLTGAVILAVNIAILPQKSCSHRVWQLSKSCLESRTCFFVF